MGLSKDSPPHLDQAVAAFNKALEVYTREEEPLEWAETQTKLGIALGRLGFSKDSSPHLDQAVEAFDKALEVVHPRRGAARMG